MGMSDWCCNPTKQQWSFIIMPVIFQLNRHQIKHEGTIKSTQLIVEYFHSVVVIEMLSFEEKNNCFHSIAAI
jgi:hypothetical protein